MTDVGVGHVALQRRITPTRVPGAEALVEICGLGVYLWLSLSADDDVAEQPYPPSGTEHVVRAQPAGRRVDPVPR
ncbi:hypothetical protein [Streptomyces sp. WZ-12]|uniref:hypothetical protein n=1 Tax=Streptomyces sp. WZ-12 TaxID=3030210 RepID=UPI0023814591|nr:hypothetical protein [Streptomyces sp. WZ-12]